MALVLAMRLQGGMQRQFLTMPAGYGKSRVIFACIVAVLQTPGRKISKFSVLFNHEAQRRDEGPRLETLAGGIGVTLTTHAC